MGIHIFIGCLLFLHFAETKVLEGDFKPCIVLSNHLYCEAKDLGNEFPTVIPGTRDIKYFTIQGCNIHSIPQNALANLTGLTDLKITKNTGLKTVHAKAFAGLSELMNLELSNSEFVDAATSLNLPSIMSSLPKLISIKIENVKLESINSVNSKAKEITLKSTGLKGIANDAFNTATSLEKIDITAAQLSGTLTWLQPLKKLHTLKLSACRLTSFVIPLVTKTIKVLNLARNKIEAVGEVSFGGSLNTIKEFDISFNPSIKQVSLSGVGKLTALESLSLARCSLITAVPDVIQKLKSLKVLNLDYTGITELAKNAFSVNKMMKTLKMSHNQRLAQIHFEAFDPLENLEQLSMSGTKFKNIVPILNGERSTSWKPMFEKFKKVTELRLVDCGLDDSFWSQLTPLVTLQKFDLGTNGFTMIPDFMFAKFADLTLLNLKNNAIKNLTSKSTYGIRKVTTFSLQSNQLVTVDSCTFKNMNISNLNLYDNPLKCDCNLKWLRESLNSITDTSIMRFVKCKSGPHNGQTILSIPASGFTCSSSDEKSPPCSTIPYTTPLPPSPPVSFELDKSGVIRIENAEVLSRWYTHYFVTYTLVNKQPKYHTGTQAITEKSATLKMMSRGENYTVCVHLFRLAPGQTKVTLSSSTSGDSLVKCSVVKLPPLTTANVGVIVGAVLGGLAFLILIVLAVICLCKHFNNKASKYSKSEEGIYEDYVYPPSTSVYSRGPNSRPPSRRFVRASEISVAGTQSTILGGPNTPASSRIDLGQSTISLAVQNNSYPARGGVDPRRFASMHNLPTGNMAASRQGVSMSMDQLNNRRQVASHVQMRDRNSEATPANRRLPTPSEDYTYIEDRDQYCKMGEEDRYLRMGTGNPDPNSHYLSMSSANSLDNVIENPTVTTDSAFEEEDSYAIGSGPPVPPRPVNGSVPRRTTNRARESQQTLISNRSSDDNSAGFQNPSMHMSAADMGSF